MLAMHNNEKNSNQANPAPDRIQQPDCNPEEGLAEDALPSQDVSPAQTKVASTFLRKPSRRREIQDDRTVMLELFKELVSTVNASYSSISIHKPKPKPVRPAKPRQKAKPNKVEPKEEKAKLEDELKQDPHSLKGELERKEMQLAKHHVFQNYAKFMQYQLLQEVPVIAPQSPI